MEIKKNQIVKVLYSNWRGETRIRTIIPIRIFFSSTDWHKEEGWLLDAYDLDRKANRSYAMKDIKSWWIEDKKS